MGHAPCTTIMDAACHKKVTRIDVRLSTQRSSPFDPIVMHVSSHSNKTTRFRDNQVTKASNRPTEPERIFVVRCIEVTQSNTDIATYGGKGLSDIRQTEGSHGRHSGRVISLKQTNTTSTDATVCSQLNWTKAMRRHEHCKGCRVSVMMPAADCL